MSFNQFQVSENSGNIPQIPNYWKSTNISETFCAKPETPCCGAYFSPENFTCPSLGQQGGLHPLPTSIPVASGSNMPAAYYALGGPSFSYDVHQRPSNWGTCQQQVSPNCTVLAPGPAPPVSVPPVVVSPTLACVYPPCPGSSNPPASSFDAPNNLMMYPESPGTYPYNWYPVPKELPKLHYHLQFFAHPVATNRPPPKSTTSKEPARQGTVVGGQSVAPSSLQWQTQLNCNAVPHSHPGHPGHSKHVKEHNGAVRGPKKPIWFQGKEKTVVVQNLEEGVSGIRLQDCSERPSIQNPNQVEVHQDIELLDGHQDEGEILQMTEASSTLCRRGSSKKKRRKYCRLCKSNKEIFKVIRSHSITDENGIVTCPILREHVCPYCKATGDNAHTLKYCPINKRVPRTSQLSQQEQTGASFHPQLIMRTSYGGYNPLKF